MREYTRYCTVVVLLQQQQYRYSISGIPGYQRYTVLYTWYLVYQSSKQVKAAPHNTRTQQQQRHSSRKRQQSEFFVFRRNPSAHDKSSEQSIRRGTAAAVPGTVQSKQQAPAAVPCSSSSSKQRSVASSSTWSTAPEQATSSKKQQQAASGTCISGCRLLLLVPVRRTSTIVGSIRRIPGIPVYVRRLSRIYLLQLFSK